jgi:amino acid transporter
MLASLTTDAVVTGTPRDDTSAPGSKGLKTGALGFISSVVIGVASTAPGYSLAASLGVVAAAVGFQAPAIMWVAFLPMFFIAASYYAMNRVDPDCGTTFTWVTRGLGPWAGWVSGWALLVADILVMASLSQIAGKYTFLLFGANGLSNSVWWVTTVGVLWIAVMSWICYVGIEISARTQWFLLGAEISVLAVFAVVALVRVYAGSFADAVHPSLSWLNPFTLSSAALSAGVLTAVFIYWGWDTAVAVNEETEDASRTPGKAAVVSTLLLLGIYVIVAVAAQAVHGAGFLVKNQDDVLSALGSSVLPGGLDKLLIIAVLTSASASTQTTILPATRAALSMAAHGAAPKQFAAINPRYLTPGISTIWMGAVSIAWYVLLTLVSQNILADSITATGLAIAFYLGITGVACVAYYRKALLGDWRTFLVAGVGSALGALMLGWVFVKSVIDLANPANSTSGQSWFGVGAPLGIGILTGLLGIVLMIAWWRVAPAFFQRKLETADPDTRV